MTDKNVKVSSGGVGFCGLLCLLFIALKLLGKITWSWIWVLAPLWVPIAIALFIIVLFGILFILG